MKILMGLVGNDGKHFPQLINSSLQKKLTTEKNLIKINAVFKKYFFNYIYKYSIEILFATYVTRIQ